MKQKQEDKTMKRFLCGFFTTMMFLALTGILYGADQSAVIVTADSGYTSGAHTVISVDPVGGPRQSYTNLIPTGSDLTVAAYGRHFYRIERSNANNITKFSISDPSAPVWQWSTEGTESGSNPHDLIFVNATKAYLLRYGSTRAWIVNPSAIAESDFKTGEIDLSRYSDGDGFPEMHSGVIVNGNLFITLQRVDTSGGWGNFVYNTPYVAVIDTVTDQEIDTGQGAGNLIGIPLPMENPGAIQYLSENNTIYVQGVGQYDTAYTSGIATINPLTYETSFLLDDGDAASHPYGAISGMLIASATKGYFIGYAGWGNNTLYTFDPSSANPTGTAVSGFNNISIAGMEGGVYLDKNDMLWVCNQTHARVDILNVDTDQIDESVSTGLNPLKVVFVDGKVGSDPDEDDDDDSGCFIQTAAGMIF